MKNLNVLDSPVITIEGALVTNLSGNGFVLIRNDTLENIVIEQIVDDLFTLKSLLIFENKIVKATGRMWKTTFLADKIELAK